MTIIESVKNFIATCPYLDELARVHVDYLPEAEGTYSIEETPSQTVISTDIDGTQHKQFNFVLAARFLYSDELANNIDNCGFYEDFESWLHTCTEAGTLPTMASGLTPTSIEATSHGYLYDLASDMRTARYQIQCRLLYDKE